CYAILDIPLFPYTTLFRSLFGNLLLLRMLSDRDNLRFEVRNGTWRVSLLLRNLQPRLRFIQHLRNCNFITWCVQLFKFRLYFVVDRKSTRLNSSHVSISYA